MEWRCITSDGMKPVGIGEGRRPVVSSGDHMKLNIESGGGVNTRNSSALLPFCNKVTFNALYIFVYVFECDSDMVLLHSEIEVEYPDRRPTGKYQEMLLEFGKTKNDRFTTAMALTIGVPAKLAPTPKSLIIS